MGILDLDIVSKTDELVESNINRLDLFTRISAKKISDIILYDYRFCNYLQRETIDYDLMLVNRQPSSSSHWSETLYIHATSLFDDMTNNGGQSDIRAINQFINGLSEMIYDEINKILNNPSKNIQINNIEGAYVVLNPADSEQSSKEVYVKF